MSWARLDDSMCFHSKIVTAGNAAVGVWSRMISWSSQHLTDGVVPDKIARVISGESRGALASLVRSGLLHQCPSGYEIHDYLEYNPSKAETEEKREKERGRKSRISARNPSGSGSDSGSPVPTRPDPIPLNEGEVIGGPEFNDTDRLTPQRVEQFGATRFGMIGGRDAPALVALCPIMGWEMRAALARKVRYWGGFITVMREIREESAKPKPPPAGDQPKTKEELDYDRRLAAFMKATENDERL